MNLINRSERFPKSFRAMLVCLLCICFFLMVFELLTWNQDNIRIPGTTPGNVVFFFEELSHNARIADIDASEQFIFFLYPSHGVVSAYGWDGKYKFSMAFYRYANGTLDMQISNELLYVNDFEQYTFIIDGEKLISTLPPEENSNSYLWYQQSSNLVYTEQGKVFDMNGTYIMSIPGRY